MTAFTGPFNLLAYDLPWSVDEDPIPSLNDWLVKRLSSAYGFDEEDDVPRFLWRENIDCVAPGSVQPAPPQYPRWGECHLPISYTVYERIRPAMRRVGAMMAMSECFFAKILFAEVKSFADPALYGFTYLEPNYNIPTEEERDILARTIEGLRSSLRFFMGLDREFVGYHGRASGRLDTAGSSLFYRLEVGIRPTYLLFFSNLDYHLVDEGNKNAVLFSLAVTILHEMAHIFWMIRQAWARIKLIEDGTYVTVSSPWKPQPEPLMEIGVPHRELGRAWEHFFFGGFPEMRGLIKDSRAENPFLWVTGTQLLSWQRLLRANVGPQTVEGPIDALVEAFFDDEIFKLVRVELEERRNAAGGELESLTFEEALGMAYRIASDTD